MSFLISDAHAQSAPAQGSDPLFSWLILIGMFVLFYFMLIRPQQKRAKEHKQMLSAIQKGDNVITSGGIHGKVASVNEDSISLEISDGVKVKVSKEAVTVRKSQG